MIRRRLSLGSVLLLGLAATAHAACGGGSTTSCGDGCGAGQVCRDGRCVAETGGTGGAGTTSGSGAGGEGILTDGGPGCPAAQQCGAVCCDTGQVCALGQKCAVDQGACASNDECGFDAYCEAGVCVPYGLPGGRDHDPSCKLQIDIGAITPAEQCRWSGPPAGDLHPADYQVMSTPVVVDFDFDGDPTTLAPSIIFSSFQTAGNWSNSGTLRIIDGKTCAQQFSFDDPADRVLSSSSVAVGDLDGDGRAEIVAGTQSGGLLAFKYDPQQGTFTRLWRSGACGPSGGPPTAPDAVGAGNPWSGPSIHDLDDDGVPEIVYGASVYGADGCVLSSALGFAPYSFGYVPVIADVDGDGKMELVQGQSIHEWDAATRSWVPEPYFHATGANAAGQVAVADFGSFPLASLGGKDGPEVAVISNGTARVQTLEGTVIFGPVAIPGGGVGGPPTIADFDGDGRRELATAGGGRYVVFDLDCVAGGDPAKCGGQAKADGVLWSQPSQDGSSNVTGSSVFDFDADGAAEAVYADECFLRIYEGATGKVLYSVARASNTTYENPVIVDVDGDYRTEIVSSLNDYMPACPATDPLFPSAPFSTGHGVVVLRDEQDRWAASRPIWNQHAYAVTHVGDRGEIPKTSQVKRNWEDPQLNNFRQNVQGGLEALGVPDLTAGGQVGAVACQGTVATIEGRICNRGTLPMVSGTEVSFQEGDGNGPELCAAPIPVALGVGECMVVSCEADLGGRTVDVYVSVDPHGASRECWEQNNHALYKGVACGQVPS